MLWIPLAALLAAPVFAGTSEAASAGYEARVEQHARNAVERHAQTLEWQNYTLAVEAWLPGQSENHPVCQGVVTAEPARADGRLWGRIPYTLRCSDPVWEVRGRAEVSLHVPVVTARRNLSRGQVLNQRTMALTQKDLAGVYGGFVTDMRQLAGQRTKRAMRAGQVISMSQVAAPLLVERGDHVLIRVIADGMHASMTGEALESGAQGEGIKVRNHSSGKVITAWVAEKGIVETRF
jgi:flagella basal body P-ring formation protein FlgA